MTQQIEAPDFSVGEDPANLLIRVDSGKYMETVYGYGEMVYNETSKMLDYSVHISPLIVNGIQREVDKMLPEELAEFYSTVATPIIEDLRRELLETTPQ